MISVKALTEDRLNSLWREFSNEEYCQIAPFCVDEIPEQGIIFIGINPSISESEREKLKGRNIDCVFYKLSYDEKNAHKYFKRFFDVAEKTNMHWGHLDLLYLKEMNQKKVKKIFKSPRGIDFIYRQCMISKTILDRIINKDKPRIFVVNNALARDLLGEYHESPPMQKSTHWIGYDFVWNEELGTYTYLNNIFFFTSMLTGQRALDNGSYKRLLWHINYVKQKLNL